MYSSNYRRIRNQPRRRIKPGWLIIVPLALIVLAATSGLILGLGMAFLGSAGRVQAQECSINRDPSGLYTVSVCITQPRDSAVLKGTQQVSVALGITGPNPGVQQMTLLLDGQPLVLAYVPSEGFDLPTNRFEDGVHLLQVKVSMNDGFSPPSTGIILVFNNGLARLPTRTPLLDAGLINTETPTEEPSSTPTETPTPDPAPLYVRPVQPAAPPPPVATDVPTDTQPVLDTPIPDIPPPDEPLPTDVPFDTETPVPTDTWTPTVTATPTITRTATRTRTPTPRATRTITATVTMTPTPTAAKKQASPTPTRALQTGTPTRAFTPTPTPTGTPARKGTPTRTKTPSPTSALKTFTFGPAADTYVDASQPKKNLGASPSLLIGASPARRAYVRFNLPGLSGVVVKATLRIYANSGSAIGYQVHSVLSQTWNEKTMTFANAVPISPTVISTSGSFLAGTWTTVDLTPFMAGKKGTISLGLITSSPTAINLASREAAPHAPQLIIVTRPLQLIPPGP